MSSFMFVMSNKALESASTEYLEERLKEEQFVVDNFDWGSYKVCSFDSDRAEGANDNVKRITAELEFRKNNKTV
jgi:hypothetical protein